MGKKIKNENREKNEQAREMYIRGVSQTEICERLGIMQATLRSWRDAESWDTLRDVMSTSQSVRLQAAYKQLDAVILQIQNNKYIPNKALNDAQSMALRQIAMFSENSISTYIDCFEVFIKYLCRHYPNKTKEFTNIYMEFIQSLQSHASQ